MMTKFASLALLMAVLSACQGDETVRDYGGIGKIWTLQELSGKKFTASAMLAFTQAGKIAGDAPCNSYSATMSAPYPWFEAGPIAATKRACPNLREETAFFHALSKVTLSEVLADTLVLSNPDGLEMVFKASE